MSDPAVRALQTENASLRRAVTELTVLNDIAREIGALTDLEEVMQRIISKSAKAVEAQQGTITLVAAEASGEGHTLVRTMASSAEMQPFHLSESVIGWMQLHRKPLLVNDPRRDGRFRPAEWEEGIRSMLSVPLTVRGRLTGVLTVCNKCGEGAFTDADERLLSIIAMQSAQVIENARLYEEEQALMRVQEELRTAFEIQSNLLPKAVPKLRGYDVAGTMKPAQQVGGDFYDYIRLGEDRIGLCVGDVSGKGLPAALLMASALATIRSYVTRHASPAEAMARINRALFKRVKRGNFLTLFHAELNTSRNSVHYVNGGHNRPILLRHDGSHTELRKGGIALGIVPKAAYEQEAVELERGEVLVIYSDGVTEAMTPAREQYGEERLLHLLQNNMTEPAAVLVRRIVESVEGFSTGAGQSDDITVLVLRRE